MRSNGNYWSSTPKADSQNAYNLNFNTSNANPENTNNRANGQAVRCVQHLLLTPGSFLLFKTHPVASRLIQALLATLIALAGSYHLQAQPVRKDSISMKVYFLQGQASIEPDYRDNLYQMEAFKARLSELVSQGGRPASVIVRTAASPEGGVRRNKELCVLRANSIRTFLLGLGSIDSTKVTLVPVGEDWEGLAGRLRSLDEPWAGEALSIVLGAPEDARKRALVALDRGAAWAYLEKNVFPDLRQAGGAVSCVFELPSAPAAGVVRDTVYVRDTLYAASPAEKGKAPRRPYSEGRKLLFAARTNILAVPLANVGLELPLGRHFSLGADVYYPWLPRDGKQQFCFQFMAAGLEARYWFGRKRLLGHSIGLYAAGGLYDFEFDGKGHQGEFTNAGLDYLYAFPLFGGRMHMELELGVGFIYSTAQPYDCFAEGEKCYRRVGVQENVRWWGPTRAQISLVLPIYGKAKKGGGE